MDECFDFDLIGDGKPLTAEERARADELRAQIDASEDPKAFRKALPDEDRVLLMRAETRWSAGAIRMLMGMGQEQGKDPIDPRDCYF